MENKNENKQVEIPSPLTLKLAEVVFDIPLKAYQIPQFRGAMVATLGRELDKFHNHKGDKFYHYRYPMVQYRQNRGKASMILLLLDKKRTDLLHVINACGDDIRIGSQKYALQIDTFKVHKYVPHITETPQPYRLYHWMGLNTENFKKWQNTRGLLTKAVLIQDILVNHIMQFAKAIGWYPSEKLEVEVTVLQAMKFLRLHNTHHLALNLSFRLNAALPYQIGLGKGVSHGFGILKKGRESDGF